MTQFRSHPDPKQWDDYVDYESTSWPKKDRRHYWIIPRIERDVFRRFVHLPTRTIEDDV